MYAERAVCAESGRSYLTKWYWHRKEIAAFGFTHDCLLCPSPNCVCLDMCVPEVVSNKLWDEWHAANYGMSDKYPSIHTDGADPFLAVQIPGRLYPIRLEYVSLLAPGSGENDRVGSNKRAQYAGDDDERAHARQEAQGREERGTHGEREQGKDGGPGWGERAKSRDEVPTQGYARGCRTDGEAGRQADAG